MPKTALSGMLNHPKTWTNLNQWGASKEEPKHVRHDVIADDTGNGDDEPKARRGKEPRETVSISWSGCILWPRHVCLHYVSFGYQRCVIWPLVVSFELDNQLSQGAQNAVLLLTKQMRLPVLCFLPLFDLQKKKKFSCPPFFCKSDQSS